MKRALTIIALAAPLALRAQTGVVTTHPATPEGKLLTMEEAVLGRNVRPASVSASWKDNARTASGCRRISAQEM